MIKTNTYRCEEGSRRQTAADMEKSNLVCCTHGLPWKCIPNSRIDVRLSSDPPGTPLTRKVEDEH